MFISVTEVYRRIAEPERLRSAHAREAKDQVLELVAGLFEKFLCRLRLQFRHESLDFREFNFGRSLVAYSPIQLP